MRSYDEWTEDRLEAVAVFMYRLALEMNVFDGHCKSYDPLQIEGSVAHSYIMNLRDGGRHHRFDGLDDLAQQMKEEFIEWFDIKPVEDEDDD